MKASDLAAATRLAADRAARIALRDRLRGGDALAVVLGEGGDSAIIQLAPAYLARLRADLVQAFDGDIADKALQLEKLGVEP